MTRINTNVGSLVAQNRLQQTNRDLSTSLTRLSTGLRINSGADDPAGLIASEALRSDITSINTALSNTQRASQIIATADSALGQVSSLLNDVRGLVVEAANSGALSDDEIAANQLQVDSSLQAINRIAQTTTFQGRRLLDGSLDFNTTSGQNFTSISNLQINQANLGSTGAVALDIEVTSAATRGEVNIANVPAAGDAGTGGLTLTNRAADAEASVTFDSGTSSTFTVTAQDGSAIDGTAGNDISVNVVNGRTAATSNAVTAVQTVNTSGQFSVSVRDGSEAFGGALGNSLTVNVVAGNTATAQAESAGQTVNGVENAFTISAQADGDFDGAAGNALDVVVVAGTPTAGNASAAVSGNTLTITVDDAGAVSLADIQTALEADADFTDEFEFNIADGQENLLFRGDGSDNISSFELDGATAGTDAVATVDVDTDTDTITITVNDNADQNLSDIQTALAADATFNADFSFNVGVDAAFRAAGTDDASGVSLAGGTNAAAEATFADNVLNVVVNDQNAESAADVVAALEADADIAALFAFSGAAGTFVVDGSEDATGLALTGGTDTTSEDTLTITGPSGAVNNGSVSFVTSDAATAPTATVDEDGNLTVTVSSSADTSLASIQAAIDTLDGFSAELGTASGDQIFNAATDTVATQDITGATDGGISDDVVFELGSEQGSQVFEISAGTTAEQLRDQINLVSEATGVSASIDADTNSLVLNSLAFGSNAEVDLRIIDEAETGTFTSALGGVRANDTGTDVVARINGIEASGDGNELSVTTSTLDISLSVDEGFSGNIDFTITGGGAQFQLGPEVVANQQARIGIGSLNTAQLGGVSGQLFQLAEGGDAALAENAGLASRIVDEAIDQVTGLRGRLGAFQATTLESNLVSLSDTVSNLFEAESTIRDADFAAESAQLTRNQILIQSGTSVLGIANQNPQNVLGLIR